MKSHFASLSLLLFLCVQCSFSSTIVKREAKGFELSDLANSEFVASYETLITTGTESYEQFASACNFTGTFRAQLSSDLKWSVQLEDIKFGAYNGKYNFEKSPPIFGLKSYDELKVLETPFQVAISDGKISEVVLGDLPVWAQNIQRGLAAVFQFNAPKVNEGVQSFSVDEDSLWGNCPTSYGVAAIDNGIQVSKFTRHSECKDSPDLVRKPNIALYKCQDSETKDVFSSNAYSVFVFEQIDGKWVTKQVKTGSATMFHPFGNEGMKLYTWSHSTIEKISFKQGGFDKIVLPSNTEKTDLRYVFEHELSEDEDITKPSPFFFHYSDVEVDQDKISTQLHDAIEEAVKSLGNMKVFNDMKKFHKISPFAIIPLASSLDYEHLKKCHEMFKAHAEHNKKEYEMFVDALAMAGTGPGALLLRDIVSGTDDTFLIGRSIGPISNYLRNPTENLLKEFEGLVRTTPTSTIKEKVNARIIDLAFGTLLGRGCQKTQCSDSGILKKWTDHYSQKYDSATSFEEKTAAVHVLRNIGLDQAIDKLVAIATNKNEERTVRSAAIEGVKNTDSNKNLIREKIIPIFYDRSNHPEVRNKAALWSLVRDGSVSMMNDIALFLWSEPCPFIRNFVRSVMYGMAHSTRPCIKNTKGSAARQALQFYPPGQIENTKSLVKIIDYYDQQYHFGQMSHLEVHRSGESALPTAITFGLNAAIGGYGISYLTVAVRLEGVGKKALKKFTEMTLGSLDSEQIEEIFKSVGVKERQPTPLKIELAIMLQNRVVTYHALDDTSIAKLPQLLQQAKNLRSGYDLSTSRSFLLGGVLYQTPCHFGTPQSMFGAASSIAHLKIEAKGGKSGTSVTRETDMNMEMHIFGLASLANHIPPFGSMHSVTALRTMRSRLPRKFSIGVDIKSKALNFNVKVPSKEDPIMGQVHGTIFTSVRSDSPDRTKDADIAKLLKDSCSECKEKALVSKGEEFRRERRIGFLYKFDPLKGAELGAQYFDCEKDHSRGYVIKELRKHFGDENKNAGPFNSPVYKTLLGMQSLRDHLFLQPNTETCGFKWFYYNDPSEPTVFDRVEGSVRVKVDSNPDKKFGTKFNIKSSVNFVFTGADAKIKTVDVNGFFKTTGFEKRDFKMRVSCKDDKNPSYNYVACMDINGKGKRVNDFFSYEGEEEPTYERTTDIVWGKMTGKDKDSGCPSGVAGVKMVRKSRRSAVQIQESLSEDWPYKQCREQRASGKYPGPLVPATEECVWSAFEQTNLRESNITIDYRVPKQARERWKTAINLATLFLAPYLVSEEDREPHLAVMPVVQDGDYVEGNVRIDVSADSKRPMLDIHWHGSEGQDKHFHQVDMHFLPGELGKGRPVYSRFDKFHSELFRQGFYGYCDITSKSVQTFDFLKYDSQLEDCPTLVSGDCVGDEPTYALLAKKMGDKIGITFHIGDSKIDLETPTAAKVNGNNVALNFDEIYTSEDDIFTMFATDKNNLYILSQKLGIVVRYTGYYATLSLGSRYRGTQCGLCGSFNGSKKDDFTGPDGTSKLAADKMVDAFKVRKGSCA